MEQQPCRNPGVTGSAVALDITFYLILDEQNR
jgi:hypothetical protein